MCQLKQRSVIHILDDDETARDSLQFLIETSGFKVKTHEDLDSFLDSYNTTETSCLILDVRLPGTSGFEIQKQLPSIYNIMVPIIFISGHAKNCSLQQETENDYVAFLEKPCDPTVLMEYITIALEKSR